MIPGVQECSIILQNTTKCFLTCFLYTNEKVSVHNLADENTWSVFFYTFTYK